MNTKEILISAIDKFRKSIIGIYLPNYNPKEFEFIIEIDEHLIKTISIGKWLGVVEKNYPVNLGRVVMIDCYQDGASLYTLLQNPYEFINFVTENQIK